MYTHRKILTLTRRPPSPQTPSHARTRPCPLPHSLLSARPSLCDSAPRPPSVTQRGAPPLPEQRRHCLSSLSLFIDAAGAAPLLHPWIRPNPWRARSQAAGSGATTSTPTTKQIPLSPLSLLSSPLQSLSPIAFSSVIAPRELWIGDHRAPTTTTRRN